MLTVVKSKRNVSESDTIIVVKISEQKLYLLKGNGDIIIHYPVSTSKYGIGNSAGSNKTPLGTHKIAQKIGKNVPSGTIFKSRINTKKLTPIYIDPVDVPNDYVTTRIMWLEGMENGINKGKDIDSFKRFIYIHGTPEEGLIGKPASHGCIRMKNKDVIELFDKVNTSTIVEIVE